MFIELSRDENYKGTNYKKGAVIEVGGALGDLLVLSGHIKVPGKTTESTDDILSDESIDALEYKAMKELIENLEIETADNKKKTYVKALKEYYAGKRG